MSDHPENDRQPFLDLSLPQLVAGATAAATSAILISRLDLLGTVLGAAFASVVSAIVTAGLVGGWRRVRTLPSRFPRNVSGMVVTAVALGLVILAFQTGVGLVTQDLPARHLRRAVARRDRCQPRVITAKVTSEPTTTAAASAQARAGERRASRSSAT